MANVRVKGHTRNGKRVKAHTRASTRITRGVVAGTVAQAATGFMLGGPKGATVGAGFGVLGGFLGSASRRDRNRGRRGEAAAGAFLGAWATGPPAVAAGYLAHGGKRQRRKKVSRRRGL